MPKVCRPRRTESYYPQSITLLPSSGHIDILIFTMDTHTETKDGEKEAKAVNDGVTRTMSVDDELLEQLGHMQELRREFSVWSLGSLCLRLMATWEALSSVVAARLTNGGAPCLLTVLQLVCPQLLSKPLTDY